MSFWAELRRRNVFRVGAAYAIVGWLLVQVADTVLPIFEAPTWIIQVFTLFILLGFPLALLLSWAYELTPVGIKRTKDVPEGESVTRNTGRTLNYTVTVLLVVAVAYIFIDTYELDGSTPSGFEQAESANALGRGIPGVDGQSTTLSNSVAVLPCDSFSTDPNDSFFAASLHEELLNQLSKLRNMNVIARTSVLQYSGVARPITEIAAELRVETIMECSVAYGDGRIVIGVQLIDGADGIHLWSDRYNREFEDVFGIQADIAMNVANALAVEFSLEEQRAIERAPTDSPEAYALYLQALSVAGIDDAETISLLGRALVFDEEFVSAHRLKAMRHAAALVNTTGSDAISASERERQAELASFHAARAGQIDATLDWFAGTVGNAYTWHWNQALAVLDRAPDPLDQVTIWLYSFVGEHDKAITRARRWVQLDPRNWTASWTLGVALAYAGEIDEAARIHREVIEVAPAVPVLRSWLAFIEIARGNQDAAGIELERTEQLLAANRAAIFLPELAYSYSRIGRSSDVDRIISEIGQAQDGIEIGSGGWAMVYLALGDTSSAIEQLEVAASKIENHEIDEGFFNLMNLRMNVTSDTILEEGSFVELRTRLRGN